MARPTTPTGAISAPELRSMTFGKLDLAFTTDFELIWEDRGSGARNDVAFWRPKPPTDFFALGSVCVGHYGSINGEVAALCVKPIAEAGDALAQPVRFERIWTDKGSGAKHDGSCWRPIAPEGYRALGDVFVKGYDSPPTDIVRCVREDLTYPAVVGGTIWEDRGSGADQDFGAWAIDVPGGYIDALRGLFAPNTFVGNDRHSPPKGAPVLHCLNLTVPAKEYEEPKSPRLTSTDPPPVITPKTLDHVVYLPFTAINDPDRSVAWKVENSPFYAVEREVAYQVEIWDFNESSTQQEVVESVTTGISKTVTEAFSLTTGISVTAESGVSVGGAGSKVSATVSVELGWQRTTGITEFEHRTVTKSVKVPPQKALALWALSYSLLVRRADNSYLPSTLTFEENFFVHSEYPDGETVVEQPPRREVATAA